MKFDKIFQFKKKLQVLLIFPQIQSYNESDPQNKTIRKNFVIFINKCKKIDISISALRISLLIDIEESSILTFLILTRWCVLFDA